ncbi:MAG: hypothetical protein JXR34_12340, partial [Bacteroidales bacterium]|nr:hypothetical protein [Bacteroidales bacterium]
MKNNSGEINAIIYSVSNQVFFLTSEVITSGIFIARNNNRETIIKCDIDHTNYGCLLLNEEIKAGENSLTF